MSLDADKNYPDLDTAREIKETKDLLGQAVHLIESLSKRIDTLERRLIDDSERIHTSLVDLNKRVDSQVSRMNILYTIYNLVYKLKYKVEDLAW